MYMQEGPTGVSLGLADGDAASPGGRICWFVRIGNKGITEKGVENEVATGMVVGSAVDAFRSLLTEVYLPALAAQEPSSHWNQQRIAEFLQVVKDIASYKAT